LGLAGGELAGSDLEVFAEAHGVELNAGTRSGFGLRNTPRPWPEAYVVDDAEMGEEQVVCHDKACPALLGTYPDVVRRVVPHGAGYLNLPVLQGNQARQGMQERGLA
jgi:hypothetical protein